MTQVRDFTDFRSDSKLYFNYKYLQGRFYDQLRQLSYGLLTASIIGFVALVVFTSPIWLFFMMLNLPLIALSAYLFLYTNVRNNSLNVSI